MIDLTDKTFGRLTVIRHVSKEFWLCQCKCGQQKIARGRLLRDNKCRSCGCLKRELTIARNTAFASQNGEAIKRTPEYAAYWAMKTRCYNKKAPKYKLYGGRGIRICERWLESYANFLADMGRRPSEHHSLDRFPNKDGNYEPTNCRWATDSEQNSNRRTYTRRRKITDGCTKNR